MYLPRQSRHYSTSHTSHSGHIYGQEGIVDHVDTLGNITHCRRKREYMKKGHTNPTTNSTAVNTYAYHDFHMESVEKYNNSHRSSAAVPFDDGCDKTRQLPCKTFISVGCCPYRDRCVYIHDPRLMHPSAKSKTRKKNKEERDSQDSFYWPTVSRVSHHKGTPCNTYSVPLACCPNGGYSDAEAMYSMWNHFVDFCIDVAAKVRKRHSKSSGGQKGKSRDTAFTEQPTAYDDPLSVINKHTGKARLPVFVTLASLEDNYKEEYEPVPADAVRRHSNTSVESSSSMSSFLDELSISSSTSLQNLLSSPLSSGTDDWEVSDGFALQSANSDNYYDLNQCSASVWALSNDKKLFSIRCTSNVPRSIPIPFSSGESQTSDGRFPSHRFPRPSAHSPNSIVMALERGDLSPYRGISTKCIETGVHKSSMWCPAVDP
eukprot:CAMPEP_0185019194 /NCGR_PEP_ID=MMETSP1103-20130426/1820_1 /TAXON_ID=36769 /ORGANISM="Paraphysomonas bandaiensis, Strain Caron Lab Isolate" /LENGTH=430 /DNA_ID=CAMNT_0027549381 /DNA_START=65 /DNA_END=1357 /DNA_ORIENTATION=-